MIEEGNEEIYMKQVAMKLCLFFDLEDRTDMILRNVG
jgi:hypothetical protein